MGIFNVESTGCDNVGNGEYKEKNQTLLQGLILNKWGNGTININ